MFPELNKIPSAFAGSVFPKVFWDTDLADAGIIGRS
jgi:hypothetical protein